MIFVFHLLVCRLYPEFCKSGYILSISCSVTHAHSWKLLKPHMFAIIQDVLFPLMSYSEADEELWETDPHEYIRIKFGEFSTLSNHNYHSPSHRNQH